MKKKSFNYMVLAMLLLAVKVSAQGFTIGSGTTFTLGSSTLSLCGNWNNSGTFMAGTGTIIFSGASGNQTITNSSGEAFYNLTVNKESDNVQLVNNIIVSGTLTCINGDLDLNGSVLTLTGTLNETAGNTVIGTSGYITCVSDLNAPLAINPHNIGIVITSLSNPGTTTIIRGHAAQNGSGNTGVLRYYEINPAYNLDLDAEIVFNYDENELNSVDESLLQMFGSNDNGSTWFAYSGTPNPANNTYTLSGIGSLKRYTLASSSSPLPVELTSFSASSGINTSSYQNEHKITLNWQTATEVNNYGFEIERQVCSTQSAVGSQDNPQSEVRNPQWEFVGFVEGAGNSNSPKSYSFTDNQSFNSDVKIKYRLKQIDSDGAFTYSKEIEITVNLPEEFVLYQNYPNPFNPTTNIRFGLPVTERVVLEVYNTIGEKIITLLNTDINAGYYEVKFNGIALASGTYFYLLRAGNFISSRKFVLIK